MATKRSDAASVRQEAEALHVALRVMPREHYGYAHPSGRPFKYSPVGCPGCAHAIIREMFRERS